MTVIHARPRRARACALVALAAFFAWGCSGSSDDADDADAGDTADAPDGLDVEDVPEAGDVPDGSEATASCAVERGERTVSASDGDSFHVAAVGNGTDFGVVWVELVDAPLETGIYFARVDASGARVGDIVQLSDTFPSVVVFPSLAWSGSEYAVAWVSEGAIRFLRFGRTGTPSGAEVVVTDAGARASSLSLAAAAGEYGVAWADDRDGSFEIYFARIDADGTKIGADVRITDDPADSITPSLVWTGSEYAVSWIDDRDGTDHVYFARIDASGAKIGDDVCVVGGPEGSRYAMPAWTGTAYAVLSYGRGDGELGVFFTALDAAGTPAGAPTFVAHAEMGGRSAERIVAIVPTPTGFGAAWGDFSETGSLLEPEVYVAALDPTGVPTGLPLRVTEASGISAYPALMWSDDRFALAWDDTRNAASRRGEIFFARVACE